MIYILIAALAVINGAQLIYFKQQLNKIEQEKKEKPSIVEPQIQRSMFSILYGKL